MKQQSITSIALYFTQRMRQTMIWAEAYEMSNSNGKYFPGVDCG